MAITPTLMFGDGTANGNAGCNTFTGTWTLEGDVIAFGGPVESTGNPCEDPGGTIEKAYLTNLGLVNRVQMNGENLVLHQAQGEGFAALEYVPAGN
jgi:heat shock protein HslJ